MQYTVIIKKEHCLNTTYSDYKDCGLARAIRDQFPEFKLKSIGGSYVRDTDHNEWKFDMTCWANSQFESLLKGEIESVSVTFTSPDHIKQLQEANLKAARELVTIDNVLI